MRMKTWRGEERRRGRGRLSITSYRSLAPAAGAEGGAREG